MKGLHVEFRSTTESNVRCRLKKRRGIAVRRRTLIVPGTHRKWNSK